MLIIFLPHLTAKDLIFGGYRFWYDVLCDCLMRFLFALHHRHPSVRLSTFIKGRIAADCHRMYGHLGIDSEDLVLLLLNGLWLHPDLTFDVRKFQSLIFLVEGKILPMDRIKLIEACLDDVDNRYALGIGDVSRKRTCLDWSAKLREQLYLSRRQALAAIAAKQRPGTGTEELDEPCTPRRAM